MQRNVPGKSGKLHCDRRSNSFTQNPVLWKQQKNNLEISGGSGLEPAMKSVMLRSLAAFDICVLLSSTFFLGGDAGASTPCKDGEFYDSRKGIYRPCEECVGSLQDSCGVCCKAEITGNW